MILELKNIDKSFGEKEVLKGVSFTAEGGKAFGLLGRNGAELSSTEVPSGRVTDALCPASVMNDII